MTDSIQPFEYIKSKNIDEHNQIVDKINEIVDTVNALDIEGIPTLESDVTALKADVGQLKISDAENVADIAQAQRDISAHASEISAIKDKDVQQDTKIDTVETDITNIKANVLSNTNAITNINAKDVEQDGRITENGKTIDALTKELPTEITLYRDGTGKIRAQVEKEDSTTFDSNTLDMIIPYQYDIISGTTNRSFKLKVSFSDGSTATTNDFVIPEGGGTAVTVTGITLTKDEQNSNKFKASIVLSDSTTIDSGYLEMVTTVSGTFANNKLTIKVNGVESVPITIDTGITYTGGTGITITGGTISIDSTVVALKSEIPDVSGFATKSEIPDVSGFATKSEIPDVSGFATKSELNAVDNKVGQIQTAVGGCFNEVSIDGNVLTLTATDGQTNSVSMPSGGKRTLFTGTLGDIIKHGATFGINGHYEIELIEANVHVDNGGSVDELNISNKILPLLPLNLSYETPVTRPSLPNLFLSGPFIYTTNGSLLESYVVNETNVTIRDISVKTDYSISQSTSESIALDRGCNRFYRIWKIE